MHGTTTSVAEITNVSPYGFWLLLGTEELLVPFEHFPWFKKATIEQLFDVQWPTICIGRNLMPISQSSRFATPLHSSGLEYSGVRPSGRA